MKTRTIVSTCAALLLAAGLTNAQRTESFSTGLSLGVSEGHEIQTLSDESFCLISPSIAVPSTGLTHLVVVERTVDAPFPHYLPLTFATPVLDQVWRNPLVLSPTTVAIPGPGLDLKYGNGDDEVVIYSGLNQPTTASQIRYPLALGAPGFGTRLLRISETELGWLDPGADRLWNTGDEAFRLLRDIGPNMQEITFPLPTGADGYLFDRAEGQYVARSFGADGVFGTSDDQYTTLKLDPSRGVATSSTARLNEIMMMPPLGAQWPQGSNGDLAFPHPGPDNRLGTADDQVAIVNPESPPVAGNKAANYRQVGLGYFNAIFGTGVIGTESDGTIAIAGCGMDGSPGTADDIVGFFGPQGSIQSFAPGFALANTTNGHIYTDVMTLEGDVSLVRHYGNGSSATSSSGVLAFYKSANTGARVMANYNFGEAVRRIIPMGRAAAAFILASGQVRVAHGLDTPAPVVQTLGTQLDEGDARAVAVGPQMIVGIAGGPGGLGYSNDEFRFWRARTTMEFGEATESVAGYEMNLRSSSQTPIVGGPSFFLTLDSAPPSQNGYCLISLDRDTVLIDSGTFLHLSFESMFTPYYWATLPDGSTWFPIIPPTDPSFEGEQLHFQFLIFNPPSLRGYEISNGLTLQF